MLNIAEISPNDSAYKYFDDPGYSATIRGETIHIMKFNSVSVNFTEISKRFSV